MHKDDYAEPGDAAWDGWIPELVCCLVLLAMGLGLAAMGAFVLVYRSNSDGFGFMFAALGLMAMACGFGSLEVDWRRRKEWEAYYVAQQAKRSGE